MSNQDSAVTLRHPVTFDNHSIKRIPSLELQTLAFMSAVRAQGTYREIRLRRNDFHVWLGFDPEFSIKAGRTLKNAFFILDVYTPIKYRFQGWLTRYWQLCQQLAGGTLLIFGSPPPKLEASLQRYGFKQVDQQFWLIQT